MAKARESHVLDGFLVRNSSYAKRREDEYRVRD